MRAHVLVTSLCSSILACSANNNEGVADSSVPAERNLPDIGLSVDAGLAACKLECALPIPCFSSPTPCENNCIAYFTTAYDQSRECGTCVLKLFEKRNCPNTYSDALLRCDVCELECVEGKSPCGKTCIDLGTDPANCGTCGTKCDENEGFACIEGKCSCRSGMTDCSGKCVNTNTDVKNCGTCGKACPPRAFCNGACIPCPEPKMICDRTCIDPQSDNQHCGTCGNACAADAGLSCQSGSCQCTDVARTKCGDACVDTLTNPSFCGSCNCACAIDEDCINGQCGSCP